VTALWNALDDVVALFALSAIPAVLVGRQARAGALSFLRIHAAAFTGVMGFASFVFVRRAASDPWWPHPMLLPFLGLAVLLWAVELLALRAIIYSARLRGAGAGPPYLFTRMLAVLVLAIAAGMVMWSVLDS